MSGPHEIVVGLQGLHLGRTQMLGVGAGRLPGQRSRVAVSQDEDGASKRKRPRHDLEDLRNRLLDALEARQQLTDLVEPLQAFARPLAPGMRTSAHRRPSPTRSPIRTPPGATLK